MVHTDLPVDEEALRNHVLGLTQQWFDMCSPKTTITLGDITKLDAMLADAILAGPPRLDRKIYSDERPPDGLYLVPGTRRNTYVELMWFGPTPELGFLQTPLLRLAVEVDLWLNPCPGEVRTLVRYCVRYRGDQKFLVDEAMLSSSFHLRRDLARLEWADVEQGKLPPPAE